LETSIKAMTDAMAHRGPNGEGHHIEDTFAFGHRRLSIVDLSDAGHQPMIYIDRYVITYNGEIYNHGDLRAELENVGYHFNGHSDTEVILAAYDFWGVECLAKFNGMWAFVIYDRQNKSFFISRDRFGVKPLYFCQTEKTFIFSSEIKPIFEYPGFEKRI
ncbi:asparagine synthetase B, partial [Chromobacterium piscinae]